MATSATIESLDDFKDDKAGDWSRWQAEFDASNKASKKWRKQGNRTVSRYSGSRRGGEEDSTPGLSLNLFWSNINTVQSMMFGKLPEISISRINEDFNDDPARVAGMMLQRMLSSDIGTPNDQYSESLKQNLEDRLLPGLGVSRVRYEFDEEEVDVAPVFDQQTGQQLQPASKQTEIVDERAPLDYVHWRDFAWGPARTWAEVPWVAFKTLLTRAQCVERFGDKVGKAIPLTAQNYEKRDNEFDDDQSEKQDAWSRAEVWEIWNKQDKQVYWWCKDYKTLLDKKEDPLGLAGFFPIPEPMASNLTTTAYMPIPDFIMAQDLYNEVDHLETRIARITEAVKVVGVYDQSAEGVKRMLSEGVENDLIPVDNWAMFAEKGGIAGTVDWMPIETIAATMNQLVLRRDDAKALLYEISGISDVMRGAQKAAGGAVSATERALEARFASVRIQALQDEFAKYATDLIRLRAEVVSLHFQPKSIVEQSNILNTPDEALIEPALKLIKDDRKLVWRIQVRPESVAMVDYAQLSQERGAYINGLATFLQSAAPLVAQDPSATPFLLEMLKWGLAGFKGSEQIEGVLDQAITQMQQSQKEGGGEEEKPSPEEIKAKMEQAKLQHEQQKIQAEQQFEQQKWQYNQQVAQQESQQRMQEIQAEAQAKQQHEQVQAQLNIEEKYVETEEMNKRETHKADEAIRVQTAKAMLDSVDEQESDF